MKGAQGISEVDDDVQAVSPSATNANNTSTDHSSQSRSRIKDPSHLEAQVQQQQQSSEIDVESRNRELSEIAKSISTLAEVFKDLQAMVIDQGTILDSIEYNVEQTAVHVQEAMKELKVATT